MPHRARSAAYVAALLLPLLAYCLVKLHRLNKLLHAVFPRFVHGALQRGQDVEPRDFPCVTVLFCDVVGFTEMSSKRTPRVVMRLLDRLYDVLDSLADKHSLFKVETIGDSYMVAGALNDGQEHDHASRVAAFALDAVEACKGVCLDEKDPSQGHIRIRVGIHSGPVVGCVVGRATPRFCLFGDTVNVAARMEQNSSPGVVTLSGRAAELLRRQNSMLDLSLMQSERAEVKGKGAMDTWVVSRTNGRAATPRWCAGNSPVRADNAQTWKRSTQSFDESRRRRSD